MKNRLYLYFLLLLLFVCTSCKRTEYIPLWQKPVLSYYSDTMPGELKYKAARFLIDNMDTHYTLQSEGIDSFRLYMDSIFRLPYRDDLFYNRAYDTAVMRYGHLMEVNQMRIPDTSTVTAEYLKANIDSAFRMWRWTTALSTSATTYSLIALGTNH